LTTSEEVTLEGIAEITSSTSGSATLYPLTFKKLVKVYLLCFVVSVVFME
jgi:hypothetical protein